MHILTCQKNIKHVRKDITKLQAEFYNIYVNKKAQLNPMYSIKIWMGRHTGKLPMRQEARE